MPQPHPDLPLKASEMSALAPLLLQLLLLINISLSTCAQQTPCHSSDKKALLQIRADYNNPPDLASWNTTNPTRCCGWSFVSCDGNGRVTFIYPYYSNLTGPLSPSIAKLTKLDSLRIDGNALTGPIPSFLARLPNLVYLHLGNNQFTGTIPSFLSSLPLTLLQLDHNRFSGPLPDFLGQSPTLHYLYLSNNQFTGQIPHTFADASVLDVVDFSNNSLSGDATVLFGAKKTVTRLFLSGNEFEFDFSRVVLPENMTDMDLSHNRIYGSIPPGIAQLRKLRSLDLSYNQLCGEIPTGGRMGRFGKSKFLHNKCLCGGPLLACT